MRMARETNKETKCYMRVWADKSNIDCCCSGACQPTHVASTINIYNKIHKNLTYKIFI